MSFCKALLVLCAATIAQADGIFTYSSIEFFTDGGCSQASPTSTFVGDTCSRLGSLPAYASASCPASDDTYVVKLCISSDCSGACVSASGSADGGSCIPLPSLPYAVSHGGIKITCNRLTSLSIGLIVVAVLLFLLCAIASCLIDVLGCLCGTLRSCTRELRKCQEEGPEKPAPEQEASERLLASTQKQLVTTTRKLALAQAQTAVLNAQLNTTVARLEQDLRRARAASPPQSQGSTAMADFFARYPPTDEGDEEALGGEGSGAARSR